MQTSGGERNQRKRINANTYVFAALALISFALLFFSTRSFFIDLKDMGLSMFS